MDDGMSPMSDQSLSAAELAARLTGAAVAFGGISCTTLTTSGILNATHSTSGDNAAYLRNTHAAGYGPVFRGGGGGAGLYAALFQKYDGTELARINETGAATFASSVSCTTGAFSGGLAPGTPGATDVLIGAGQIKTGAGVSCTTLTSNAGGLAQSNIFIGSSSVATWGALNLLNGPTHRAWMVSAQNNINEGLEITPSTAAGGATFTTPALVVTSPDHANGLGAYTTGYLKCGALTSLGKITTVSAVPGSFADLAAVQTWLAAQFT